MNALETSARSTMMEINEESNDHDLEDVMVEDNMQTSTSGSATITHRERKSIFDKWSEKLKDFLDNAE